VVFVDAVRVCVATALDAAPLTAADAPSCAAAVSGVALASDDPSERTAFEPCPHALAAIATATAADVKAVRFMSAGA
jgi:hypothetical protein